MSGGSLCNYDQYKIGYIADAIETLIIKNGKPKRKDDIYSWEDENSAYYEYSPEVIEKFEEAVRVLKIAECYAHRVDWLVSGDDGPERRAFFCKIISKILDSCCKTSYL